MYRILDSSINRVSEGLRVIEDIMRFKFNNLQYSKKLKRLRHSVRNTLKSRDLYFLSSRNIKSDCGLRVDKDLNMLMSKSIRTILLGNFKRVQEGLRTLEEACCINELFLESDMFKELRYKSYEIEKEILLTFSSYNFKLPELYGITYLKDSNNRSNVQVVKEMIDSGIEIIQYREKDLTLAEKFIECIQIRELTNRSNVTFIVNDNIDLAILVEADGVHIGQDDLPVNEVRKLVGNNKIIGVSTHSPSQAKKAVIDGADYIGVGPIYSTKTKENVCDAVGLEYLKWVKNNIDIPFVTIGGIKQHNLEDVVKNGGECIALVSYITSSDSIKERVKSIRNQIEEIKNGI